MLSFCAFGGAAEPRDVSRLTYMKKAREVYLAACAEIAATLTHDGFGYSKAGPRLRRVRGDFCHEISFQSSHKNATGQLVVRWIHAVVTSRRLKEWRAANPLSGSPPHDFLAGGQVGNLSRPTAWLQWNLAENSALQIADAIRTIRNIALPYFDQFENIPALVPKVIAHQIPELLPSCAIEFLLSFAGKDAADLAVRSFFTQHPQLVPEFEEWVREFTASGLPRKTPNGYAKEIANAVVAFDLQRSPAN